LIIISATLPDDIVCKEGFELLKRVSDGTPVCITHITASKLIEMNWAKK